MCQCSRACQELASRCLLVTLYSWLPSRHTPGQLQRPCSLGTGIPCCKRMLSREEPDFLESTSPGDVDHTRPGTLPALRPVLTASGTKPEQDSLTSSWGRCGRLPVLPSSHTEHTCLPVTESTQTYGPSSSSTDTRASRHLCIPQDRCYTSSFELRCGGGIRTHDLRVMGPAS